MAFKMVFVPEHAQAVGRWVEILSDTVPQAVFVAPGTIEETLQEIIDADAAFGTLPREALAAAKRLKWVQAPAAAPPAGYYSKELVNHPCQVTNFRGIYNDHISAHIMAAVLAFTKNLHIYRDRQDQRLWEPLGEEMHSVFLPESTALIVGVGGIGGETARLCKAFGMKVLGVDARISQKSEWVDEIHGPDGLDSLLPQADFVILTIPHTPATEGLFNGSKFSLIKKGAFFINIGRGMTVKLADLEKAVNSGRLAGAALDVFEEEPLPKNSPLWNMKNLIITPHVAAQGGKNIEERRFKIILENVRRIMNGRELINVVDKAQWF